MKEAQELHRDVREATQQHLAALDATVPGLVSGLYLTGSVALGAYQPGRSDIDFIAFTTRPVSDADVALLRTVHASLPTAPCYDGNYVGWHELPDVPDDERPAPHVVNGEFNGKKPNHQLTPATWAEFARYGIALRGPAVAGLGVSVAPERLRQWTLDNLNGYWQRQVDQVMPILAQREPGEPASAEAVAWAVLGPPRLHYTLATGDIISKPAAGGYALRLFPDYENLITAALAWRATGAGEFSTSDALQAGDLASKIIADANRRWGNSAG